MTLSGTPVADPYFAAARRGPSPTHQHEQTIEQDQVDEVVAAVLARVGVFTADLWSSLQPTTELDPELTLTATDRASDVRVEAHVADPAGDSQTLARLRSELEQRGWDVSGEGSLEAHLDGGTVTASYADAGVELTVDSAPLPVGSERAASLVRDGLAA